MLRVQFDPLKYFLWHLFILAVSVFAILFFTVNIIHTYVSNKIIKITIIRFHRLRFSNLTNFIFYSTVTGNDFYYINCEHYNRHYIRNKNISIKALFKKRLLRNGPVERKIQFCYNSLIIS